MDTDDDQRQQQQDGQQQQQDTTADEEVSDTDAVAADGGEGGEEVEDDQGQSPSAGSDSVLVINAVTNLDSLYGLREIGRDALCWQLSSAKPGNGVEQIRDANTDTYWQSDGMSQPHLIQVHFARRVAISHACIYLDYNLDESYTPKHITIQVGMTTQDLVPAVYSANIVELNEPVGWVIIPLTSQPDPLDYITADDLGENGLPKSRRLVRTHFVQIEICSMHQNGRDTHIRQVQLYGPRTTANLDNTFRETELAVICNHDNDTSVVDDLKKRTMDDDWTTTAMSQFSSIR